jgi:hypothetical protein
MNGLKRLTIAVVATAIAGAGLAVSPAASSDAHADTLVLGNSKKSNTAFYAYANRNCKGKKDYVNVGELAHGIGAAGSIMIPANSGGIASPYYIIKRKTKDRCWNTPNQVATSVYLNRKKAGSWSVQPTKEQLVKEASNFKKASNF